MNERMNERVGRSSRRQGKTGGGGGEARVFFHEPQSDSCMWVIKHTPKVFSRMCLVRALFLLLALVVVRLWLGGGSGSG